LQQEEARVAIGAQLHKSPPAWQPEARVPERTATLDAPSPRPTVGQLLRLYEAEVLADHRRGASELRSLLRIAGPLEHKECADVSWNDIGPIIEPIAAEAPIHANRILGYFSAFCTWAIDHGDLDENPLAYTEKPSNEVPRDRKLTLSEIVEIWRAAQDLNYPFGPVVRLLILTAARREEVARIRRTDLGHQAGCPTLAVKAHRSAFDRPFLIPLAPMAHRIVDGAIGAAPRGSKFVFTTTGSTPISGWKRVKRRLDDTIRANRRVLGCDEDLAHWRLNDLRQSFLSVCAQQLDADPEVVGRCLNRLSDVRGGELARAVAPYEDQFELRRDVLFAWARLIDERVELAGSP
jgi:integrase